jgi:hypothetical protein
MGNLSAWLHTVLIGVLIVVELVKIKNDRNSGKR